MNERPQSSSTKDPEVLRFIWVFCNLFVDKHISRTRDCKHYSSVVCCCERWLTAGKSEKWDVVSLKYEGVPSRAGKPSGWEASREKLTMEKSHIKLTWAATMALGGHSSCFTDTLSWPDCPFHLWSLLALSSGVKIAETRKSDVPGDPPLNRLSVQADISPVNNIHWRVTGADDSAQLNFCVTPAVFRGRSHRRPSSTQMSSRAKWAGSAFRMKSSGKRNIRKQYLYTLQGATQFKKRFRRIEIQSHWRIPVQVTTKSYINYLAVLSLIRIPTKK